MFEHFSRVVLVLIVSWVVTKLNCSISLAKIGVDLIYKNAMYFKFLRGYVPANFDCIRHIVHAKFCPSKELPTFVQISGK